MYKKSFLQALLFSIIMLVLHIGINSFLNKINTTDIILVHVVLFLLTFGGSCLLLATAKYDINKVGFAFLAVSTIKVLVSASLILIMVRGFGKPKVIGVHYATVYLFYVSYLAYQTFALINKK